MYTIDLPKELLKDYEDAEKNGLFEDFHCAHDVPHKIDFRKEKIKPDGLHFICDCGDYDIIGEDIVKSAAEEYRESLK